MNPNEDALTSPNLKSILQGSFSEDDTTKEDPTVDSKDGSKNCQISIMAVESLKTVSEDRFDRSKGGNDNISKFFVSEQFRDGDEDGVRRSLHLIFLEIDIDEKREAAKAHVEGYIASHKSG